MVYCTDCEMEVNLTTGFRCLNCGGGRTIPAPPELVQRLPGTVRAERLSAAVDDLENRRGRQQRREG